MQRSRSTRPASACSGFFIFIFFNFVFYKNIFLFSKFTGIYPGRPAAGWPGPGRPAAGRQGLFCKNFHGKFALKPLEDRSPDSGTAGPGRPAAGRSPPRPYIMVWLPLTPSFASLKIQKKKRKEREGGRGGVRERQSGEGLSDFQAGDCR